MKAEFCQSFGMQMMLTDQFGTNTDGSPNEEYCSYCYQDGTFTEDYTMDGMIDYCLQFLDEFNKDTERPCMKEEAWSEMEKFFPMLKRWKV